MARLILERMTKLGENLERGGGGELHIFWSLGTVTEERWLFLNDKKIEICEKNLGGVESIPLESVFRRNHFQKYPPKNAPLH